MSTPAETTSEQVVYIGRNQARDGKIAHWYRKIVDGQLTDSEVGSYKPYVSAPIGAIVTLTQPADEPDSVYTRGAHAPQLTGSWSDEEAINEWRTRDRAEYQRDANERRVKRDLAGLPDEFEQALEVLGKHFSRLNSSQRAALLTVVTARLYRY